LRYVMVIPVWGASFRELWADFAAASFLAPGNISALKRSGTVHILLFTTHEDSEWFSKHRWVRMLSAMATVELVHFPEEALRPDQSLPSGQQVRHKYGVHRECFRYALNRYASDPDAVLLPLWGDVCWTSGFGETIAEAMAAGRHGFVSASLAVDLDAIGPTVRALVDRSGPRAFDAREMVELSLAHLHSKTLSQIWTSGTSSENYSYFYWPVGNEGLICHSIHPVPIALHLGRIDRKVFEFAGTTLDMDVVFKAVPDPANIGTLDDSMKGCPLELVRSDYQRPPLFNDPWTPEKLAIDLVNFQGWGILFDPAAQSKIALTPVRFRHGPAGEEWTKVETQSRRLIQATLDCMKASAAG